MAGEKFDASLPSTYSENWREAYRKENSDSPRMASYQAPGGEPITFIQKTFEFSGGQSKDTEEYPFDGLWSNESLNEKPQSLIVKGYLRGANYIGQRNALIEALRVPTDDDNPAYIDFPFWGRFPVVVADYRVAEDTDAQGQCEVSLTLTRAGVSITDRFASQAAAIKNVATTAANLTEAAKKEFEKSILKDISSDVFNVTTSLESETMASGFGKFVTGLLSVVGRVQGAITFINTMTNKVLSVQRIIAQGIRAPFDLANSFMNAMYAIYDGLIEIANEASVYEWTSDSDNSREDTASSGYPAPESDNLKKSLVNFLSASTYTVDTPVATVNQETIKKAMENLYRTAAFAISAKIMTAMENLSFQKASGYWNLFAKLEESIDTENPEIHTAITETRIAVSAELSGQDISAELSRRITTPMPLLSLAHYLGCDDAALRRLNSIADSFVIEGNIIYV